MGRDDEWRETSLCIPLQVEDAIKDKSRVLAMHGLGTAPGPAWHRVAKGVRNRITLPGAHASRRGLPGSLQADGSHPQLV